MDFKNEFKRIMENAVELSLATSVDNVPNVRILTFCYDEQKEGVAYIATYNQSPKTEEFAKNNKVAFTTIPVGPDAVRVTNASIQKSELTVHDLKDNFIRKFPGFQATYDYAGPMMDIYEIHFNEAFVIIGFNNTDKISL